MNFNNSSNAYVLQFNFAVCNGFKGDFSAYVANSLKCENEIRNRCGIPKLTKAQFLSSKGL